MRYWDTSALAAVVVTEPGSHLVDRWVHEDEEVCTWGLTRVELASAVERRAREGALSPSERREALALIGKVADAATEVLDLEAVRVKACALLSRHSLRAADAVQLAAALVVAEEGFPGLPFVCLDRKLAAAAEREGLQVLTWPD